MSVCDQRTSGSVSLLLAIPATIFDRQPVVELLLAKGAGVNIQNVRVSSCAPARSFQMCFGE